ncbi:leucine-rich repeat-containing G-protein coupled receptor 4 [Pieris rapae]|uniref:leucine-rich repeat-containing G-protein coupled receptor 4 n=1 Tax=Pieris rapae TaxID=64459 RepID=UPI001E27F526|nr:leucine-rich repeat-containing G-protein coupled receptor 4 [Pieris rapae]
MDVGVIAVVVWLLPTVVLSGVLRDDIDFEDDPCRTYSQDGLWFLDCSDRGLTELPDNLNYDVQVLILANNNFVSFPKQLEQFSNLHTLDLSGNRLATTLPAYMESFQSLKILNLSNNNYDTWHASQRTFNINRLDLSKNKINGIEEDAFTRLRNLSFLDLSENRLNDLPKTMFSHATHLFELNLSRNYFLSVPQFQSQYLRILHLSNCQIAGFSKTAISEMTSLLVLDLSINQIESIPDDFESLTLQDLILSYNEINMLTDNTFSSLPHLAVLDLRGNAFKEVWLTSYFSSNPFLRSVYVKGNRWSCEGFSVNLLLTYDFLTKEPSKVSDKASLICYSPSNVTQLTWQQAYIRTWHADDGSGNGYTFMAVMIGVIIGIVLTSFVCRSLMFINKPEPSRTAANTVLNGRTTSPTPAVNNETETRIPLRVTSNRDDLPPTYDEALLLPQLTSSFHSLPDFIDTEENLRRNRRSRSIGDLTEPRPRLGDRRSIRRTVRLSSNVETRENL